MILQKPWEAIGKLTFHKCPRALVEQLWNNAKMNIFNGPCNKKHVHAPNVPGLVLEAFPVEALGHG